MPSISSTSLANLARNTDEATKKAADTYNQFLMLLTTQLQNQDPLDPMQSNEFTNQLVQFSQVEQGILTNTKLDSLLTQNSSNQITQALGYIGQGVYYKGDTVAFEGDDIKIGYAIDGDTKSAKMRILDKDGQVVRTMDITPGNTSGSLVWDGKDDFEQALDEGNYTVRVDALSKTDAPLKSYTGVPARVKGVETIDGVLYLALNGDRRIAAEEVLSISEPETEADEETTPTTPTTT